MRAKGVTRVELSSKLRVLRNITFNAAESHGFRRLRKILNSVLNCGNSRVYYISISHRQKRRIRLRSLCNFEGNKNYGLFHDCHREVPGGIKLVLKIRLNFH